MQQLNEDGGNDCHKPKTSVNTSESQPEIQDNETENERTERAKG